MDILCNIRVKGTLEKRRLYVTIYFISNPFVIYFSIVVGLCMLLTQSTKRYILADYKYSVKHMYIARV